MLLFLRKFQHRGKNWMIVQPGAHKTPKRIRESDKFIGFVSDAPHRLVSHTEMTYRVCE